MHGYLIVWESNNLFWIISLGVDPTKLILIICLFKSHFTCKSLNNQNSIDARTTNNLLSYLQTMKRSSDTISCNLCCYDYDYFISQNRVQNEKSKAP